MKKFISWVLVLYICFVFIQSLFFKFAGSIETVIIFETISNWMSGNFLSFLAPFFKNYGGWAVGGAELLTSVLLLIPASRRIGAILALIIMSGAIFFHLATPLGLDRIIDEAGNTDGGVLFFMACGVWVSSLILILLHRKPKSIYR
ncbi:MAG: hypothetical protein R3E62_07050 [Pseudomonadales bacterium]|jgi:uncharacterized membrane protein YphA (DoxX/SURF4 family)